MKFLHWLRNIFKRPMPSNIVDVYPNEVTLKGYIKPKPIVIPRKRKKLKFCPVMSKNMHTRESAQRECLRLTTKLKPLRIYLCEYCSTWHLTHKKKGYGR